MKKNPNSFHHQKVPHHAQCGDAVTNCTSGRRLSWTGKVCSLSFWLPSAHGPPDMSHFYAPGDDLNEQCGESYTPTLSTARVWGPLTPTVPVCQVMACLCSVFQNCIPTPSTFSSGGKFD